MSSGFKWIGAGLVLALLVVTPGAADAPLTARLRQLGVALDGDPANVELRFERVDAYLEVDRHQDALADLALLEGLTPGDARVSLARAVALTGLGRHGGALAELDAFISRSGGTARAHRLRAHLLVEVGRQAEALHDYDAAIALGDRVETHLDRGRLLERLGRLDEAAAGYRAGIHGSGGAAVLRLALVDLERRRRHFGEALAQVDALMGHARVRTRWLLLRADVLAESGDARGARQAREAALEDAERLLSRRPSALAFLGRARALLALGHAERAIADAERALRSSPRLTEARAVLTAARAEGGAR